MTIQKLYNYMFYVFYKSVNKNVSIFPADFIAAINIQAVGMLFLLSLKLYQSVFFDVHTLSAFETITEIVILFLINSINFFYKKKWKNHVLEFEKWTDRKNQAGKWIVRGIVILIVLSILFAGHILNERNAIKP